MNTNGPKTEPWVTFIWCFKIWLCHHVWCHSVTLIASPTRSTFQWKFILECSLPLFQSPVEDNEQPEINEAAGDERDYDENEADNDYIQKEERPPDGDDESAVVDGEGVEPEVGKLGLDAHLHF